MKTIAIDILSPDTIVKAIDELNQYKKDLENKVNRLLQLMTASGAEIVRAKIVEMGAYATGELLSGVVGYYSPSLNAGFVRVTSDHVAFVEFGTGVKGQTSPHKNGEYLSKAAWSYASGSHIFTTQNGRTGWFYPKDDGTFRFTEGMASRPFMYETALQLKNEFPRIAREVFAT